MTIIQSNSNYIGNRIQAVDFVRGLVMILMAIDHVRVYSGIPAGGSDAGIFFTRWVTHFCAPVFVFLSGTSAYLKGNKTGDLAELMKYLLSRGFMLIVLEFTVIRFFWSFNFNYSQFTLAGVIWMLGCCMILLGFMVRLKPLTVGIIGLVIIFGQNLFALVPLLLPESARQPFGMFWEFIYPSGFHGPSFIAILYVIVPWIGVMAAGYGFGVILQMEPQRKNKLLIRMGLGLTIAFLLLATLATLSNTSGKQTPFIFALLNQRKYPASQLFLMMTLGPAILLMPFVEKAKGFVSNAIILIGRVPLFYYILHILLIHVSALVVQLIKEGRTIPEYFSTAPYVGYPKEHWWSLGLLYLVFVVNVIMLYFLCKWYDTYKSNHPEKKWLTYI